MIAENLAIFLQDFGVPCSCGATQFVGVLDSPTDVLNMGGTNVLSDMWALLVRSSDVTAAGIATGSSVTVSGTVYTVRDVLLQDDGAFSILNLSK